MLSFAVIFAAISIYNERYHGTADEYGRLFGKQVAGPNGDIARKMDVIKEGPVADQKAADPMLVAQLAARVGRGARRERECVDVRRIRHGHHDDVVAEILGECTP